jgi:ABC-type multidrug transport system fused ATPase/permease subunit
MHKIVPISGIGLHGKLLATVLDATFVFISRIDSGSIINRFNQDLLLVDLTLPLDLLNTTAYIFVVTVQTILVVIAAIYLLAAIPVLAAVLWVLQHIYLRTSKRLRQLDLETKSGLQTKISESYQGIATLRAHGWQSTIRNEFWTKLDESQRPFYMLFMVQTWLQFVLNMIVAGLATTVAGVAVGTLGKISTGAIGIAFLNIVTLGEGLTNLIHSWTSLETSLGAIARIRAFEKDTPLEKEVEDPTELPPSWPSSGALVLDHVWASYHPERATATWSLQDVSVQIHPGERVAICGRSGSGKSTFLMALLGLVETPKGTIQLDGVDISRVPGDTLRKKYFVISQDAFLHGESMREMLDPDRQHSDETIHGVLRDCAIEKKVLECGGLSSSLQDMNLSVGEIQLFALARTILQAGATSGGVILLDEATGR